jgi:large subunit ribosomal protein L24
MSKWSRKGDKVVVTAGNDKGKIGSVIGRSAERVLIQGVNIRKKHMKAQNKAAGSQIIEVERPIHISNVSVCDENGKSVKLKVKLNEDGSRDLVYKKDGSLTVYRNIVKHG